MMQNIKEKITLFADLESSSSRKELLTALFESSVINTLILDITCTESIHMVKLSWISFHQINVILQRLPMFPCDKDDSNLV
jgi:hypothetical protein